MINLSSFTDDELLRFSGSIDCMRLDGNETYDVMLEIRDRWIRARGAISYFEARDAEITANTLHKLSQPLTTIGSDELLTAMASEWDMKE